MAEVTIYTLAKDLNMSPSMVSRALNPKGRISEEKRRVVLAAAEKYGFSPNKFASRLSMAAVRVGVLILSRFPVNTEKMLSGIRAAHGEWKDYKVEYDITVIDPRQCAREEILEAMRRYQAFDGVILAGMSAAEYTEWINGLYAVNKNVVQVQAINQEAHCLFASKHDEKTASFLAAEFLDHCLRYAPRKNVLLFTGDGQSALHARAAEAFSAACDQMGLSLLCTIDMKDSEEVLEKLLPSVFAEYGDRIDGIYITSGLSAPLCRYLVKEGRGIPLVAFDTYEEVKKHLQSGTVAATVSQNVPRQMKAAFSLLVKHLITGEECPEVVYTDVQLVFKGNMHQFD